MSSGQMSKCETMPILIIYQYHNVMADYRVRFIFKVDGMWIEVDSYTYCSHKLIKIQIKTLTYSETCFCR